MHVTAESRAAGQNWFDFENFHDATWAEYSWIETPRGDPDFISRSGSVYWDLGWGVARHADHWGRVRRCRWSFEGSVTLLRPVTGACAYADFQRIVGLSIERDRSLVVAPHSRPSLIGRTLSMIPAPKPGRAPRRGIVEVIGETPFRLELADGRSVPRRSLGTAWEIGATPPTGRSAPW